MVYLFSSPCQGEDEGEGGTSIHQYLTQKPHAMSRARLRAISAHPPLDIGVRLNGQSRTTLMKMGKNLKRIDCVPLYPWRELDRY
jgi:hypothetical protein